jgi:hypothetical protein
MNERYTSIKRVLDRIMQHPLLQDISLETAVSYTIDFMRILGSPTVFEEKTKELEVSNYRTLLPNDYYQMIQARVLSHDGTTYCHNKLIMKAATGSFFMSDIKGKSLMTSYKVQGGIIYTSIKDAIIEIAYQAIPTDDDGYPLIPDNSSFTRALELYIKKEWFTILFDTNRISQAVLQNTQQAYSFAVGDCQSEGIRMNLDQMEAFSNSYRTLLVRANEHKYGFENSGMKEEIGVQ